MTRGPSTRRWWGLGLGVALFAGACTVPSTAPPADAPTLCARTATSGQSVAIVDEGGSRPVVHSFEARNDDEFRRKVEELATRGTVLAAGEDERIRALAPDGANPYYGAPSMPNQWSFQSTYVDFPTAWNTNGQTGAGTRVAVLDTGVDALHVDLNSGGAHVVAGRDFIGGDQASDFGRMDGNGHGTHVAGIVAGMDDGHPIVGGAFATTIVPVRVLDCLGVGGSTQLATGIMWAADQSASGGRADVINLSLGGFSDPNGVLQAAVDYATARNVVVVAAAGNCGTGSEGGCGGTANRVSYPAANTGVIAVGATGYLVTSKASYSNSNTYVDVAAPGSRIVSTYSTHPNRQPCPNAPAGGYCELQGTSMATPHVSAVAALVLGKCPGLTPAQVLTRITTGTGTVTGFSGGVGMVKAGSATAGACS